MLSLIILILTVVIGIFVVQVFQTDLKMRVTVRRCERRVASCERANL